MGKLSALPQDTAPTGDDYTVSVDTTSGQTKKVLLSDLLSYIYNNKPTSNIQTTTITPANFTTSSVSYTDYTGVSVSITTSANTSGKVLVELYCGWVDNTTAGALSYTSITNSSNTELVSGIKGGIGASNYGVPVYMKVLVTGLSASTSYTYKARVKVGSGSGVWGSSVITGTTITATEVFA